MISSRAASTQPAILEWRGRAVLIYRTLFGWEYSSIQNPGELVHTPRGCCQCAEDRKGTILAAGSWLADVGWEVGDPLDDFPAWFTDLRERREIVERRQWQLRYKAIRELGYDETEAHGMAFSQVLPEAKAF
jgi:hypothetical protein